MLKGTLSSPQLRESPEPMLKVEGEQSAEKKTGKLLGLLVWIIDLCAT